MADPIYIDQLADFACRDSSEIRPGETVLVVHAPRVEMEDFLLPLFALEPSLTIATADGFQNLTWAQLYNSLHSTGAAEDDSFVEVASPEGDSVAEVFFYTTTEGKQKHIYSSDCGITPYASGELNPANFVVRLEVLKAAVEYSELTWSPEYVTTVENFNRSVA
jgi:hypothetical protein